MGRSGKLKAVNDYLIDQLIDDKHYDIHPDGKVYTRVAKTGQIFVDKDKWRLTVNIRPSGHRIIRYCYKHLQLARIVYRAYNGQLAEDLVVYHKDYDITNNDKDNLIMGTMSEMNKHTTKNPNRKHNPTRHYKISFEVAENIRLGSSKGLSYPHLVHKYGVCKSTISYVVNQKTWKRSVHTPNKKYNY